MVPTSNNVTPRLFRWSWMSSVIVCGAQPHGEVVADQVRLADERLFHWGGQVRPTARSFARYASSAGVFAFAVAAPLIRAAQAIIGMPSTASQRDEGI